MGRVNSMLPNARAKDFWGKASNVTKYSGRVNGISGMLEHGASTAEVALVTKLRTLESVQTYNRASSRLAAPRMILGAILKTNDDSVEEFNSSAV